MQSSPRPARLRYGGAIAAVVLAVLLRRALDPALGELFPFATLFLAVLTVAGSAGRGPALLATGLGAIASARFLLPPRGSFAVRGVENQAGLALYLAVGAGIALLGGALRAARRRAEEQADEAVRQREQLRITLASIGDAILVTDADGRVASLNPVAEALTGWPSAEAAGRPLPSVFRIVNEETRREVEDPALRALRDGVIVGLANHTVLIARDGSERPIDDSAAPIRGADGRVAGAVLVFRDITERRRAEAEVRRAGEQARTILESITDAFFALGRDWRFTYVNRQAERVLGRRPGDLLGRSLWDAYPGIVGSAFERAYRRSAAERVAISFTSYYPDHDRWYEVHSYPAPDGLSIYFRDVTERVRSEERERRILADAALSDAKFRAFFEQGPLFAGMMALDGTVLEANRLSLEACGYTREVVVGRPFWECPWWSPSAALAGQVRAGSLRAAVGETFRAELPYYVADGDERTVDLIILPVRDEAGRVVFLAPTGTDITDRKRAEIALRQGEARFRHLAGAMPQIVWITGPDHAVEFYNERWFQYTGLTPEESYRPDGWRAPVHPDDILRIVEASARSHASGEPFEAEYRLKDRHGAYRWHLGRSVAVRDEAGRIVRRFGTTTDIDDRKRSERDARFLAEASATLAAIGDEARTLQQVAALAVPFFADWCSVDLADEGGQIRRLAVAHIDPAKVELAHDLHRRYPPDPGAAGGLPEVIRTGESRLIAVISDEMIVAGARDEGHLRILRELGLTSYMCAPLRGRAGTLGAISFVAAESGRLYGAEDLRLAEDLASRAAIAIENARLYGQLKDADRRKDEFLATLAHELRNPLAPIRNALHLLRGPGGDSPMEAERAMAERNVVHLARLIDDLMDVARINRGRIELNKQVVDLATVVHHAIETARPLIVERRHELIVAVAEGTIRLEADPTRLEQVFWNLLNNAAKYTEPGGQIRLSVEPDGAEVVVRVRDTGIGIEPEMLPRVFEMFVQVVAHRGHAQGGLGIGLGLVRTLVELHGGSIAARSAGPGMGSEFIVRLPILPRPAAVEAPARAPRRGATDEAPRRRILVVDDNVDAARSLARLLTRLHNQEVRVAHDGPEALGIAGEFRPEVILLDIGLPGIDGNEVARRLRVRPEFQQTLIVALTGWGQESDVERSRAAGFDHHLVKPADPGAILGLIARAREGGP